jgi:hypothetical protein
MISYLYTSVLTGQRRSATVEATGDVVKSPSNTSPVCLIPVPAQRPSWEGRRPAAGRCRAPAALEGTNMVEQLLRSITTFLEECSAPPERMACGLNSEGGVAQPTANTKTCAGASRAMTTTFVISTPGHCLQPARFDIFFPCFLPKMRDTQKPAARREQYPSVPGEETQSRWPSG